MDTGTFKTAVDIEYAPKKREESHVGTSNLSKSKLPELRMKQEKEKNDRMEGLGIVKRYLEEEKGKPIKQSTIYGSTTKIQEASTDKPRSFIDFSKKEIRKNVNNFYKRIAPQTNSQVRPGVDRKTEVRHKEDLKSHKEKINKKLGILEKQRTFVSELEQKEHELKETRNIHDELNYVLNQRLKRMESLKALVKGSQRVPPNEEFEMVNEKGNDLDGINNEITQHELIKDQLKHKLDMCKSDILKLQINIETEKDAIKQSKLVIERSKRTILNKKKQYDLTLDRQVDSIRLT